MLSRTASKSGRLSPSLNSLQTFEAAARLASLTRAAEELGVTVSAVAFQIREVEKALGQRLMRREGRGIKVSAEGVRLAGELRDPFVSIRHSLERFRAAPVSDRVVTVAMLPSFASMWLLPRLGAFQAAQPDVDLRLSTSERRVRLLAEGIDCGIRCGEGVWEGVEAVPLFPQHFSPVCHPSYIERFGRPAEPAGLPKQTLVFNIERPTEWSEWFGAAKVEGGAPATTQNVKGRELDLAAVRAGLGIGLLDISLLQRELAAGELVQLFPLVWDTGWSHFFISPAGVPLSPPCERFRRWLFSEAQASPARQKESSLRKNDDRGASC